MVVCSGQSFAGKVKGLVWQERGLWGIHLAAETVPINVTCWATHFPPSGWSGI